MVLTTKSESNESEIRSRRRQTRDLVDFPSFAPEGSGE